MTFEQAATGEDEPSGDLIHRIAKLVTATFTLAEAEGNLLHARAHREIIRKFGRFPYRNEALSRRATAPEQAYLAEGGYGETLQELQQAV